MRRPSAPGKPIDMRRLKRWVTSFRGFRLAVTEERIDRWLMQFATEDRDLAARTLDAVDFLGAEQIADAYRSLLGSLAGWHQSPAKRSGRWRFAAFSGTAGESGDEMLRRFRHANGLAPASHGELFIHRSDLLRENLHSSDTVIFVDDFAGTGTQAVDFWPQFDELLPGRPTTHLLLVAATKQASRRIEAETSLLVSAHRMLDDRHNLFLEECKKFSDADKAALLHYCQKADHKQPKGYGDCGLTLVFAHACPNNSIPILHASANGWEGLFRRYD